MSGSKVLIVEDEQALADVLADNLRDEGHDVKVAHDGHAALAAWRDGTPDLVVLDVMLPAMNGLNVCKTRRNEGDDTPVLFLSALGQADERVAGLEAGGDDYLAKPFHLPEFLLRVRALLRRGRSAPERTLTFGGHEVDLLAWRVTLANGQHENLSEREMGLLKILASRPGEVVPRDDILDEVWGDDVFPSSRTVDNVVVKLRKLFEPNPSEPTFIHTVWGVGYRFTPEGSS